MGNKSFVKDSVLFDLDGTLLDSIGDIVDCANLMLESYNVAPKTKTEIMECIGDGLIELIRRVLPHILDETVLNEALLLYRRHYAQRQFNKTRPYDGILEMLVALKQAGYKVGVVTNKAESAANLLTDRYFPNLIDITIGDDFVRPLKPDPAPLHHILKLLGSTAQDAIFVGDTEVDILAAKNAGVFSIGVTYGYREKELLIANGADCLADTAGEVQKIIQKINKN